MGMFEEISKRSGIISCECSCEKCRNMCRTPCIGTPEDIEKLIAAGYGNRLEITFWGVGVLAGVTDKIIKMIAPRQERNGWCTFRRPDGLCELHDKGLKPTEGRLASCKPKPKGWTLRNDITVLTAMTWVPLQKMFTDAKFIAENLVDS